MSQQEQNQSPDHIDQEVSEQEQLMRYRRKFLIELLCIIMS